LISLEQRIRPAPTARPWLRELLGAWLLIAVTLVMLASWGVDEQRHLKDVVGEMYSFYLMLAVAFTVALRQGAVDLSIWATAALGGVIAAATGHAGGGPGIAFLASGLVGCCVGALNGLVVTKGRVPSLVVTFISGLAVAWALRAAFETDVYRAPDGMFSTWLAMIPAGFRDASWPWSGRPPFVLRIVLVIVIYTAVNVAALAIYVAGPVFAGRSRKHRQALLLCGSLAASGALAGLAGAVWLAERGSTPVPSRVLGDLRVPAAALLAGACLFAGRGRALLALVALGPATLAATVWRVEVAHLSVGPFHLQVVLLLGMTIVAQLAITHVANARRDRIAFAAMPTGLTFHGIVVFAIAAMADGLAFRRICQVGGLAVWLVGAALLVISYRLAAKSSATCPE